MIAVWDARQLPLADGSVDLVLTDPPYSVKYHRLWREMVAEAARVLRPGGFLAVMVGILGLDILFAACREAGLNYYALYVQYLPGGATGIVWRRSGHRHIPIIARCKYVAVFTKDKGLAQMTTVNFVVASQAPKRWHEWAQDVDTFRYFVEAFSPPGGLVLDPMAGSGTTAIAAAVIDRYWAVGDIDIRAAKTMRHRIIERQRAGLMCPLPLFNMS